MYSITKDPMSLGLIGFFQFLPVFIFSSWAGTFSDTHSKTKNLFLSSLILSITGALFPFFLQAHLPTTAAVYALLFLNGIGRTFKSPARSALLPLIVKKSELGQALSLSSGAWQIATILGPVSAGLIMGWWPNAWLICFIYAGLQLISGVTSLLIHEPKVEKQPAGLSRWQQIKEGWSFVLHSKPLLSTISLDLMAVFFGGVMALLPAFAQDILKTDEFGLGLMRSAPAVGAMFTAGLLYLYRKRYDPTKKAGQNMVVFVFLFGLATIFFAVSTNFAWSCLMLFFTGAFDHISVLVRGAILADVTPNDKLGRVNAINSLFIGASNELGDFESGLAASYLGLAPATLIGGVGCWVAIGLILKHWPQLWTHQINSSEKN